MVIAGRIHPRTITLEVALASGQTLAEAVRFDPRRRSRQDRARRPKR
jgi:hypothetical protein